MAFADRLASALEARGFEVTIDRRGLPALEDRRRELLGFIRAAETVVFIVSASSAGSPVCAWQIEQIAALNKRLAPVVLEPVENDGISGDVTKIEAVFFDPPNVWDSQIEKLAAALNTDSAWLKEHSRLTDLALRWQEGNRPEGQLLKRAGIRAAQQWAASRPENAPAPPEAVLDFLNASSEHEGTDDERQRRTVGRAIREAGGASA